jgi:hypothetical protein
MAIINVIDRNIGCAGTVGVDRIGRNDQDGAVLRAAGGMHFRLRFTSATHHHFGDIRGSGLLLKFGLQGGRQMFPDLRIIQKSRTKFFADDLLDYFRGAFLRERTLAMGMKKKANADGDQESMAHGAVEMVLQDNVFLISPLRSRPSDSLSCRHVEPPLRTLAGHAPAPGHRPIL